MEIGSGRDVLNLAINVVPPPSPPPPHPWRGGILNGIPLGQINPQSAIFVAHLVKICHDLLMQ